MECTDLLKDNHTYIPFLYPCKSALLTEQMKQNEEKMVTWQNGVSHISFSLSPDLKLAIAMIQYQRAR